MDSYNNNALFLNVTTFYLPALLPKSTLIAASFYHQSPVIAYLIPQQNQGVFKIQCKNEDDYNKLRTFKLIITDEKIKQIIEIPPEEPNRHFPKGNPNFENGTLITIQEACKNGMEKETNEEIDKFFSQFEEIIRKTWFSTYKGNHQPNGNRSLVMQVNEGMGIKRKLMYTGITRGRKGRIRVYYKLQPYLCGRCNTVHESQCPKRKEELIKEAEKLDRRLKTKTLVVSDSTFWLTNQVALNADVTCIPGGQIGHLC